MTTFPVEFLWRLVASAVPEKIDVQGEYIQHMYAGLTPQSHLVVTGKELMESVTRSKR